MQTREQYYATEVYKKAVAIKSKYNKDGWAKYGSMAHKLPVLIRSAGLIQALSFLETRDEIQRDLLPDLADVMGYENSANLVEATRTANLSEYMQLTEHALSALLWFKRYAQSVLEVESAEGVGSD